MRFSYQLVRQHIRTHHPNCPSRVVSAITSRVVHRKWKDCTLGQAVGIAMQGYVRHNMTDYDQWYRIPGIEKVEARLIALPEVKDIISSWGVKADVNGADSEEQTGWTSASPTPSPTASGG